VIILVSSPDGYMYKPPLVNCGNLCLEFFKSLTLSGEKAGEARDDHVRPYMNEGTSVEQVWMCCEVASCQHVEFSSVDR
jgi:hypothetical protein